MSLSLESELYKGSSLAPVETLKKSWYKGCFPLVYFIRDTLAEKKGTNCSSLGGHGGHYLGESKGTRRIQTAQFKYGPCGIFFGTHPAEIGSYKPRIRVIGVLFGCFARNIQGDSWFTWWFNHLRAIYFPVDGCELHFAPFRIPGWRIPL